MIRRTLLATLVLAVSSLTAFGDAKDDLAAALKKTGDSASYTWTSAVENAGGQGFGGGTTTGKIEKDGYAHVAIAGAQGNVTDVYVNTKNKKAVTKNMDGAWQSTDELAAATQAAAAAGGGRGRGRGGAALTLMQNFSTPIAQANDNLARMTNIKAADGGFTADMNEEGARGMMAFGGRGGRGGAGAGGGATITNPKATVKATLKDGAVSKLVYHVTGNMSFNGNDIAVDRTTTVDIKDVGSTKVEVPADAKKKID